MPSQELLGVCYSTYSFGGYPAAKAKAKKDSNQDVWYDHIIDIFHCHSMAGEKIGDVGAGEGLLAKAIAKRFPDIQSYKAIDYHAIPENAQSLVGSFPIEWVQKDLSRDWDLKNCFDRVFCIAVLEHVTDPNALIQKMIDSVRPGGKIHVIAPVVDSLAFKFLGMRWPYLIPGEHLSLPSIKGLRAMLSKKNVKVLTLKKSPITYSTNYILGSLFGVKLKSFFDIALKLPVGIFSMTIERLPEADTEKC